MSDLGKHKEKVAKYHIIVTGKLENPYYEVLYYDLTDNKWHIGYSSYCLDVVKGYIEDYFEVDESVVCENVLDTLEKQVPKKITEIHCDEYYCPNCGAENLCDQYKVTDKFCPNCGQNLDWSDKE